MIKWGIKILLIGVDLNFNFINSLWKIVDSRDVYY